MRPLPALLILGALSACTALPQGEHAAAPDRCGAMDAMGVIGYSIHEIHPHGADRTVHVSEPKGAHASHAAGYGYGGHGYAGRGPRGAAHVKDGPVHHGAPRAARAEKGPIRVTPHRFTDAKTLWLGDPYRMTVLVNGHGTIVDVVCY